MILGSLLTIVLGTPGIALASTYNCDTAPNYLHCYGTLQWNGGVNGSDVRITIEHVYDNETGGDGYARHMTNEMWLVDPNHGTRENYYISWVETGYIGENASESYFGRTPGLSIIP